MIHFTSHSLWDYLWIVELLQLVELIRSNLGLFFFFFTFLIRTQLKKFLGKSVKRAKHLAEEYGERAVNKVKSVRDEGKGNRTLHKHI